jgi:hypothetical protein
MGWHWRVTAGGMVLVFGTLELAEGRHVEGDSVTARGAILPSSPHGHSETDPPIRSNIYSINMAAQTSSLTSAQGGQPYRVL